MTSPEISVLIYTAREDYPYIGKAEGWHCFEPFLRTLSDQTFRDFELVLVDALWESRPDWFRDRPQPFPVKHVPARPNHWHELGRIGISAQINRGFAWVDGRYVWMGAENNLFPPHHLALVSELCRSGMTPVGWYGIADREYAFRPFDQPIAEMGVERGTEVDTRKSCPNVSFNLHGFTRDDLGTMDHRASRFVVDPSLTVTQCHHQNYFGYSSVHTDAAIAVNGFDELMDGRMGLQDVDFGGRLDRYGCNLVMHRNLYVIEPPTKALQDGGVFGGGIRHQVPFQCNYAIWWFNRLTNRRVNTSLPVGFIQDVQERVCGKACPIRDDCRGGRIGESKLFPFCSGEQQATALAWYTNPPGRNLSSERDLRKRSSPPYNRSCIIEAR